MFDINIHYYEQHTLKSNECVELKKRLQSNIDCSSSRPIKAIKELCLYIDMHHI